VVFGTEAGGGPKLSGVERRRRGRRWVPIERMDNSSEDEPDEHAAICPYKRKQQERLAARRVLAGCSSVTVEQPTWDPEDNIVLPIKKSKKGKKKSGKTVRKRTVYSIPTRRLIVEPAVHAAGVAKVLSAAGKMVTLYPLDAGAREHVANHAAGVAAQDVYEWNDGYSIDTLIDTEEDDDTGASAFIGYTQLEGVLQTARELARDLVGGEQDDYEHYHIITSMSGGDVPKFLAYATTCCVRSRGEVSAERRKLLLGPQAYQPSDENLVAVSELLPKMMDIPKETLAIYHKLF
jgi:hypothetical protein